MARKRKSGSKKKRRKKQKESTSALPKGYLTTPKSTEDILGDLGDLGVSREEVDDYLEAVNEYAPDLSIEEAMWTCDLITENKDHFKGTVPVEMAHGVYDKSHALISERFESDASKEAQAIRLFHEFPKDERLSSSNIEPLDVLKVTLAANELKRRKAARLIKPEDVEWADAVEFPDLDATFKKGTPAQEASKEAATVISRQISLRFGAQGTKDEEEYATLVTQYLVYRFKAESSMAQVRYQIDEATGMVSALESEIADLKARIVEINKERGDGNDEMNDADLGSLIDMVRKDAPGMTIEDIAWMTDAGSVFTDPEELGKRLTERFQDRENSQDLMDAAVRMISLGRSGKSFSEGVRNSVLRKQTANEHLSIDLTVFLTTEECAALTAELSTIGLQIIDALEKAGFTSLDDMGKTAKRYQADVKKIVFPYLETKTKAEEYPHLSNDQKKAVVDYCTSMLQLFINDTTMHAENVSRIVNTVQSDEFDLLAHLYTNEEGGDFLAKVATWYKDLEKSELTGIFAIAEDFKAACEFFMPNVVYKMGRHFMPVLPSQKPGRAAVRHYLRCLHDSFDRTIEDESNNSAKLIWAALRNARVFEIQNDTFEAIFMEVQRYIWTAVAGFPAKDFNTRNSPDNQSDQSYDKAHEAMREAAGRLPVFDDIMPFDHIFVGFDKEGQHADAMSVREKLVEQPEQIISARILGYLIGPVHYNKIEVVEFIRITQPGNKDDIVAIAARLAPPPDVNGYESQGEWMHPWHYTPWLVNSILGFIHEHKTLVLEQHMSKKLKRAVVKETKTYGFDVIPRPYYMVPLKSLTVKDVARRSVGFVARRAPLSYRHDRRGHERVFIQRGPLPLSDKKRKVLEKKTGTPPVGYKVFTVDYPDAESARLMMERRQPPKRIDEWVAVKVRYIDQQVIGDNSLPYVPAVRVSTDREAKAAHISKATSRTEIV